MTLVDLGRLTWPDAAELGDDAIGLIAVGATEQHGPHLPVSMDTLLARAMAERMAERVVENIVLGPVIPVGLSDHHLDFPGTISLDAGTLTGLFDAYLAGMERMGLRRVGLLSGHGGNFGFIGEYARAASARSPQLTVAAYHELWDFLEVAMQAMRGVGLHPVASDAHGGLIETSVGLELFEDGLVRDFSTVEGYTASEPGWGQRVFSERLRAFSTTGVLGRPAGATAAAGKVVLDAVGDALAAWLAHELGATVVAR